MRDEVFDIVEATGIDPENFECVAYAPAINRLPAIVAGTYRGCNAAIRAEPRAFDVTEEAVPTSWDAIAFVSRHPGNALNELTHEERERLRAEKLTPAGAERPVGQEKVIGQPESRPAPQPAIETEVTELENGSEELQVAPASCGGENCIVFQGPEGAQESHEPTTCPQAVG
jgi:hypothetical protein